MPAFLESADAEKTHDTQPWHPTASKRHWSLKPRLLERVFARLLDTGFNLSIGTAFAFLLVSFLQLLGLFRWWEHPTQLIVYWLALSFAALAVEPIMLSMLGTTPGKALLGIKVRNAVSGGRISFQKALRRTLAMSYLTGLLFIVVPFLNVGLCLILGLLQYDRLRKKGITTWDRDLHIYYRHYNVPTDRWFFVSMLSVFAFAVIVHTLTQAANALPYIAQQLNLR